jgi:hypothetical protein
MCTDVDSLSLSAGSKVEGQIYIPVVNWLLGLLTLACVLIFRSNTAIGNGFGELSPNFPLTALCFILFDSESMQELGSHGTCCCNMSWLYVCTTQTTIDYLAGSCAMLSLHFQYVSLCQHASAACMDISPCLEL